MPKYGEIPVTNHERAHGISRALLDICHALLDAVETAGDHGVPAGVLYAACMGHMNLETFEKLMAVLCSDGKITKRGQCYFAGTK